MVAGAGGVITGASGILGGTSSAIVRVRPHLGQLTMTLMSSIGTSRHCPHSVQNTLTLGMQPPRVEYMLIVSCRVG